MSAPVLDGGLAEWLHWTLCDRSAFDRTLDLDPNLECLVPYLSLPSRSFACLAVYAARSTKYRLVDASSRVARVNNSEFVVAFS